MLTRSELCGHRNAPFDSLFPLSCSRCDETVGFRVCWLFINKNKSKRDQSVTKREFTRNHEVCTENVRDSSQLLQITW